MYFSQKSVQQVGRNSNRKFLRDYGQSISANISPQHPMSFVVRKTCYDFHKLSFTVSEFYFICGIKNCPLVQHTVRYVGDPSFARAVSLIIYDGGRFFVQNLIIEKRVK